MNDPQWNMVSRMQVVLTSPEIIEQFVIKSRFDCPYPPSSFSSLNPPELNSSHLPSHNMHLHIIYIELLRVFGVKA